MFDQFLPDDAARPSPLEDEIFLSQRDVSLPLPINYVTDPGVSLLAACFSDGLISVSRLQRCYSNLLAVGFRRFELDLYWDEGRTSWSFCPVSMPPGLYEEDPPPSHPPSSSPSSPDTPISSGKLDANSNSDPQEGAIRQESLEEEQLEELGEWKCAPGAILSAFTRLLDSYNQATQNTLEAHLGYYIFNIHACSPFSSPTSPAPKPTTPLRVENLIETIMSGNLSSIIYTPMNLEDDRRNLNGSWFTVPSRYRPRTDYYTVEIDDNGINSTPDGWPSESFVEFSSSKRVLLSYGTIDPQMADLPVFQDDHVIFPSGYITANQSNLAINSTGGVTSGCYLRNGNGAEEVRRANSSWATYAINSLPDGDINTAIATLPRALTNCGISPLLNTSLGPTAADDIQPYKTFSDSTIWTWGPLEPRSYNATQSLGSDEHALLRCSQLTPSGRWSVTDCGTRYYIACRSSPLNWTVSDQRVSYSFAGTACPDGYTFSAPGTALENSYLTSALSRAGAFQARLRQDPSSGVLLAFNSLDVQGCWVQSSSRDGEGGMNADAGIGLGMGIGMEGSTCPYAEGGLEEFSRQRTIVVPVVAAIIVLVVSLGTLVTKGWGNRRRVRGGGRGRRTGGGDGKGWVGRGARANGFVYEGVPS